MARHVATPVVELPTMYKINLKTDAEDRAELIEFCLKNQVLGMGWGAHYFSDREPVDFDDYLAGAVSAWSSRAMGSSRTFHDAPLGSLIWFRDLHGLYYLAALTGEWKALNDECARRLDLGQIRAVTYAAVGSEAEVPGAVLRAFAAPRQLTFCRVNDDAAKAYSAMLANELLGTKRPQFAPSPMEVLRSFLAPVDVEDLVACYLQVEKGYVALPARHAKSTAVYEYALRNRDDGHTAVVQVKTGHATVLLETLDASVAAKWFVYSQSKQSFPNFVERITDHELLQFMTDKPNALPPVTARWMQRTTMSGYRACDMTSTASLRPNDLCFELNQTGTVTRMNYSSNLQCQRCEKVTRHVCELPTGASPTQGTTWTCSECGRQRPGV
jgi:hypothetical protein